MQTWTTAAVAEKEQFSYWREVLCEAFVALDPRPRNMRDGFAGTVASRSLGSTAQTIIAASAQSTDRRSEDIRRNPVEYCFVNFQLEGTCRARQDGRESLVGPNQFYIVDTTRPYFLEYETSWRVLSFRVPRPQLDRKLPGIRHATARAVDGSMGLGLVAMQFARSVEQLDDELDSETQERLSQALHDVVALALQPLAAPRETPESLRRSMRTAIVNYIDIHLADPGLDAETIARRFNVSRRHVYALFEEEEISIGRLIKERRLEHCANDLLQRGRSSVFEVALRWGFNDPAHFSRAFKSRFGVSPRVFLTQHSIPLAARR
ncbi:helix-turn-helix domain-containing protein [Pseudacidovorax intermedius]|uniref:helix-turn-helix domain-containing protein n=1 Tax=Pseudacidovorax intermedius TaxID=433924 RepID=UPI00069DB730|nr:helix-turn-helix domain-containing protein [Pseudacidovorax intermedius]